MNSYYKELIKELDNSDLDMVKLVDSISVVLYNTEYGDSVSFDIGFNPLTSKDVTIDVKLEKYGNSTKLIYSVNHSGMRFFIKFEDEDELVAVVYEILKDLVEDGQLELVDYEK